ncbi:MAG: phenylalanine--tRNA ligase subunit beta [Candidatus Micrarchaeota archaeon]|nr:phenylalanine--tRNA ligase subunit beta [Candidatus Micrarchaeota archaeon]
MATISFKSAELQKFIGREISVEEIVHSFEMLGMPVDKYDDEEIVADITNDRVDMFTVEGAGRAIGQFLGILKPKKYSIGKSDLVLHVDHVEARPFIVAFVAKNVNIDDEMIRSLIMAQEKIHETFGRKRKKIAIGIHDADKIYGPLYYREVKEINFVPLDMEKEMSIGEILKKHPKGQEYSYIFEGVDRYPMFMDSKGVLSFPPIINSERTRLTEETRNLLFDITGTSEYAIRIVGNIFATSLYDRGATIEDIELIFKDKSKRASLEFDRKEKLSVGFVNKILGMRFKSDDIISLLSRMGYVVDSVQKDKKTEGKGETEMIINVPPYRADIMHQVDFVEDIAVAYGYENFKPKLPNFSTLGSISPQSKLDQKIRELMVALGFVETNSWTLTNEETMKKALMDKKAVKIKNPRTQDFTIFRTDITPSILNILFENKTRVLPLKVFEIGRVANGKGECQTNLCCAIMGEKADFSQIATVLFEIKRFLKVSEVYIDEADKKLKSRIPPLRHLIEGRYIVLKDDETEEIVGWAGELHPQVIENFRIEYPVVLLEVRVKPSEEKKKKRKHSAYSSP